MISFPARAIQSMDTMRTFTVEIAKSRAEGDAREMNSLLVKLLYNAIFDTIYTLNDTRNTINSLRFIAISKRRLCTSRQFCLVPPASEVEGLFSRRVTNDDDR
jgi:hypothetical protein